MQSQKNLDLYNEAKKFYYEGQPIMSDMEFDELEKELWLKSDERRKKNKS